MNLCEHIVRMAAYNETMNDRLYAAAARLSPEDLRGDRGAFFGSVFGTLNHLVVADTIWLKRFSSHPARQPALDGMRAAPSPTSLGQPLADDLPGLLVLRQRLDRTIRAWAEGLREADLDDTLQYANSQGIAANKRYGSLVMHFFNHQAHHRGQATTLLSQSGIDIGVTDLLMLIPNEC